MENKFPAATQLHQDSLCHTHVRTLWYNKGGQKWLTHAHHWRSSYIALTSQRLPPKKLKEEAAVVHCISELLLCRIFGAACRFWIQQEEPLLV